jgi:hypothetical protein
MSIEIKISPVGNKVRESSCFPMGRKDISFVNIKNGLNRDSTQAFPQPSRPCFLLNADYLYIIDGKGRCLSCRNCSNAKISETIVISKSRASPKKKFFRKLITMLKQRTT